VRPYVQVSDTQAARTREVFSIHLPISSPLKKPECCVFKEYKATIMVLVQHLPVSIAYCTSSSSYPSSEVKWKSCQIGLTIRNVDSNLHPKLGGQRPHLQAYANKYYTFT
jgi:hypothetical protein